jgi:hypothetical protein
MARVPFFVEVVSSAQLANVQICRKIMAALFKEKIQPLPFASCVREVTEVLAALKARSLAPAVFVINTFYAEELLPQIDPLMGSAPAVYLRRHIFADPLTTGPDKAVARPSATLVLHNMTPRPCAEWTYGSKTADEVAADGAKALLSFLREGDFAALENYQRMQTAQMLQFRSESEADTVRHMGGPLAQGTRPSVSAKASALPSVPDQ